MWWTEAWGLSPWGGTDGTFSALAWARDELHVVVRYSMRPEAAAYDPRSYGLFEVAPTPLSPEVPAVVAVEAEASAPLAWDLVLRLSSPLGSSGALYRLVIVPYRQDVGEAGGPSIGGVVDSMRSADGSPLTSPLYLVRGVTSPATDPAVVSETTDPRLVDLDYRYTAADGALAAGYAVAPNGDVLVSSGPATLRKRIIRRLTTRKGGFAWLPDYGLLPAQSGLITGSRLAELQADAVAQLSAEPGVASATVVLRHFVGRGIVTATVSIGLSTGGSMDVEPFAILGG